MKEDYNALSPADLFQFVQNQLSALSSQVAPLTHRKMQWVYGRCMRNLGKLLVAKAGMTLSGGTEVSV